MCNCGGCSWWYTKGMLIYLDDVESMNLSTYCCKNVSSFQEMGFISTYFHWCWANLCYFHAMHFPFARWLKLSTWVRLCILARKLFVPRRSMPQSCHGVFLVYDMVVDAILSGGPRKANGYLSLKGSALRYVWLHFHIFFAFGFERLSRSHLHL